MNDQTTSRPNGLDDDEISLLDVFDFFVESWRSIVSLAILGGVVGAAVAFLMPVKYEATALIKPATVGAVKEFIVEERPVESVAILAEKMRSPTYYSVDTLQSCGLLDKTTTPAAVLAKNLNASVARNSAFVSVKFQAGSPALASQCLESVLKDVVLEQNTISGPLVQNNLKSLALYQQQLNEIEKELAKIPLNELILNLSDPKFSAAALVANLFSTKSDEVQKLRQVVEALNTANTAPQTAPASFATPIYAPDLKVAPKRGLILVISVLAGGFLGLMLAIGRRTWSKIQSERQARAIS
jgi:uncharacterized protein involved in exopolysaccharide biosynthesis